MTLSIIRHIRRLHGGSQPHLMQASDGNHYIVKLQGNPQGTKILANELLASRIAERIGLPVPRVAVVHLPEEIAACLQFETSEGRSPVVPGLHCGVKLIVCPLKGRMYHVLPRREEQNVRNRNDVIGGRLFDFWTRNRDLRQNLYWRRCAEKKFSICFIDNGHCFGGPDWKMDDIIEPPYFAESIDLGILESWIERIETITQEDLSKAASQIPPEWYGADNHALRRMLRALTVPPSGLRAVVRAAEWGNHPLPSDRLRYNRCLVLGGHLKTGHAWTSENRPWRVA